MMEKTVLFRDFEERDIDFIYKCKNDEKINRMTVGHWHPFTREEAEKWVHGCMGEHDTYKFWAVCTNDEEKRIVGWTSIDDIDRINQSVNFHGITIADADYRDGFAWIECYQFVHEYVFETLGFNRVYGSALVEHKLSPLMSDVMFYTREGVQRQAVYKNNRFYDLLFLGLLKAEYFQHKAAGDYDTKAIIKRIIKAKKEKEHKQ